MGTSQLHIDFVAEVADHIRAYCRGELNWVGVNKLVAAAAELARQRLWGRLRAAAHVHDTTVDQQAMSIVAPVFGDAGVDSHLARALHGEPDSDDIDLFQRFQAIIVRVASQELFHRWHESDPLGAKLWRQIRRGIRNDRRLTVFPCEKPVWVLLANGDDTQKNLTRFEIRRPPELLPCENGSWTATADLVVEMLSQAETATGSRHVVSIEELFAVLREHHAESALDGLIDAYDTGVPDPQLRMAVEQAIRAASNTVERKLERYGTTGKLSSEAVTRFRHALADILSDCADGGPAQSHYNYVKTHWPDLGWEDYRITYRAKFEYLAESAQGRFGEAFVENYGH